ncbi:hypothetical protein DID77_00145 [Candidatus Marinamargulisbacteria bacterium SCGC AG-439-L15]|nr:hypothetical protein DID77_00145 [Candidatus Marinamargulisbacteria bacterium SCGC AG-439-L15]
MNGMSLGSAVVPPQPSKPSKPGGGVQRRRPGTNNRVAKLSMIPNPKDVPTDANTGYPQLASGSRMAIRQLDNKNLRKNRHVGAGSKGAGNGDSPRPKMRSVAKHRGAQKISAPKRVAPGAPKRKVGVYSEPPSSPTNPTPRELRYARYLINRGGGPIAASTPKSGQGRKNAPKATTPPGGWLV